MLSSTSGMFSSFCQTGPGDLAGSSWDTTAEGPQNFPDYSEAADYYTGEPEEFYPFTHITPKPDHAEAADDLHTAWSPDAKALKAEPMRRMTSRTSSTGSHKQRSSKTSSSSSKKSRSRVQSILTSSQMSKHDITGNAAYQDGAVSNGRMMDVHQYLAQDLDTLSVSSHMNGPAFYNGIMGFPDGLHYSGDLGASAAHVNPQIINAGLIGASPQSWGSLSPVDSRYSSPGAQDGASDDVWSAVPSASSPGESHNSNSPALPGQSPRKMNGSQFVTTEDLHGNMMSSMNQDGFSLPPAFGPRRLSGEGESARDHFLYKNAYPQADGLFHCPWEGEATCNHKPEKLKCNYDKFVDSHLKPYRCKVEGCQNARFSSTACLLRHEREAHAMHGHGEKPYLCTYEGCERSQPGHGFPRQWNLRDHMRRVHNDNGTTTQAASPPPSGAAASARGRKRKNEVSEKSSSQEKSSSRKSSTKAAAEAAKAAELQSNAEYEAWYEHRTALQSLVQGYGQPDDPQTLQYIKDAQVHLTAMGKISHELVVSNKAEVLQGPYRRSWKG
ncbi:zinc finger protein GLI2 [Echria macrotheca]|uniref:Zinc finger protein GLI2 n=1 Tax=Echria macrotheca TaxID=438768 RepID=A0AAJ0FCF9_9PEZI|nr:zinc finger protein GLI2 [Echria macrotheca]